MRKGVFVVLDGIDGTGKSTQARMLSDALNSLGCKSIVTREPYLPIPKESINNLWFWEYDRELHTKAVIEYHMSCGYVVICDRFYYSTVAYQSRSDQDAATLMSRYRKEALQPDVSIILDAPLEWCIENVARRGVDRYSEFESRDRLTRARAHYLNMDCVEFIRADRDCEEVHSDILRAVKKVLPLSIGE